MSDGPAHDPVGPGPSALPWIRPQEFMSGASVFEALLLPRRCGAVIIWRRNQGTLFKGQLPPPSRRVIGGPRAEMGEQTCCCEEPAHGGGASQSSGWGTIHLPLVD